MKMWTVLLASCLLLGGCRESNLLEGLDQTQANDVVAVLQRNNIAADKNEDGKLGYSVRVGRADFAAAVDLLKAYALPTATRTEVADMFPSDALVASPRAEKARLYSALEQRLEQSLNTLDGVAAARVHVSYDLDAGEGGRKSVPVHLSALAVYERDMEPSALVNDIKRFLRNSFAGVEYENISVVLSKRAQTQHASPRAQSSSQASSVWMWAVAMIVLLSGAAAVVWQATGHRRQEKPDALHG